ncbi:MAG: hypothetical protein IPM48_06140 [Saprospiraceae bacterium]|nr:hypothetical protein [Saprospiraceae bacterium]
MIERNIGFYFSIPWKGITERTKDLFLAILITLIGLVGSYLILGGSIRDSYSNGQQENFTQDNASFNEIQKRPLLDSKASLEQDRIQIQGNLRVGESLSFYFIQFSNESRYMIDFGNGIRQRLVQPRIQFKYPYPGIYQIQLYEMKEGKWIVITTQTINIKSMSQSSLSFL